MSADILYGIDFKSRKKDHKTLAGQTDFAALEAEITAALWCQDAPEIPADYDPRGPKERA